jgi:hypothetical protein
MKRLLTVTAIVLSMTTAAYAANYKNLYAKKYWRVTIYPATGCSMASQLTLPDGGGTGFVVLTWKPNLASPLSIYVTKTGWKFEPDIETPFTVTLDKGTTEMTGVTTKNPPPALRGVIATVDEGTDWLDDVAASDHMTITFKGNEPVWNVKMGGGRDAVASMRTCISMMESGSGQATSPVPDDSFVKKVPTVPSGKSKGQRI